MLCAVWSRQTSLDTRLTESLLLLSLYCGSRECLRLSSLLPALPAAGTQPTRHTASLTRHGHMHGHSTRAHTRQDTLACRDSDSLHAGLSVVTADSCAGWTLFSLLSKSSETVLRAWGVRRGPVPFSVLLDEHEKSEREKTHIQMIYSDTASAFSHHKCACLTQNTCRSEARCARDKIDR